MGLGVVEGNPFRLILLLGFCESLHRGCLPCHEEFVQMFHFSLINRNVSVE